MKQGYSEVPAATRSRGDHEISSDACQSVADVFTRIGEKWSMLVIRKLAAGSLRFGELHRHLGPISRKILTSTLRNLERDGYLTRTITPTVPPRVDYQLTELGQGVLVPVNLLAEWALSRHSQVKAARAAYDQREG